MARRDCFQLTRAMAVWVGLLLLLTPIAAGSAPVVAFPTYNDTLEMAYLSKAIYRFHKDLSDDSVICERFNSEEEAIKSNRHCVWYHHDWNDGAQVMIVVSDNYYHAVVFAGTDDMRTALTDGNVFMTAFGDDTFHPTLPDVRVHAGFNHAVFRHGLFEQIVRILQELPNGTTHKLFTTGHSLGAADAMLCAVGLSQTAGQGRPVTSLNFGGPKTGNAAWKNLVNQNLLRLNDDDDDNHHPFLSIWRFVLGWDLVPRLPEFFSHISHTVQLHPRHTTNISIIQPYYLHKGNRTLGYAGVPFGWDAKPFVWVPGALSSHSMGRYLDFFQSYDRPWMEDFVSVEPIPDDDDQYVDPPDDDIWHTQQA